MADALEEWPSVEIFDNAGRPWIARRDAANELGCWYVYDDDGEEVMTLSEDLELDAVILRQIVDAYVLGHRRGRIAGGNLVRKGFRHLLFADQDVEDRPEGLAARVKALEEDDIRVTGRHGGLPVHG